jgi:hypothetical protein
MSVAGEGLGASVAGRSAGPWRQVVTRLRGDRTSLGAGIVLFVILVACLAAPLYASLVSGTDPFRSNLSGKIMVGGKRTAVMQPSTEGRRLGVTPIGPTWRILMRDILPNVSTTLIVYIPLMMALNITTESALSFLSVGVQSPDASWGTIILDGQALLYTRPAVSVAPGIAIVITVLALNLLGDSVRDALDPRAGRRR